MSTTIFPVTIRSCEGHQRFDTYSEADRHAWYQLSRRRSFDDDFMLAAYFCRRCGGWHVGNPREESSERWSSSLA